MHSQPPRTPAEEALVDAYVERMARLPGDPAIVARRDAAVEQLKRGLPTRRVESWHYTDFRRLLTAVPPHDETLSVKPIASLLEGATVLSLLNGRTPETAPAIEGVTLRRLQSMLSDGAFAPALCIQGNDDTVGALNAAFVEDGWFVDVADNVTVEAPLELQNLHAGGQTHVRLPVRVGAGAKVTIIERQTGTGAALVSSISHLTVGEGAEVRWLIVQDQPLDTVHLGQFNASIGKDGKLLLFIMNSGGKLVRQEVRVTADGEGGEFTLRALNLLAGDAHTDLTMVLDHKVPNTASTEVVRNVVTDRARGVFQGRINVFQHAQKTDAKMACNTLLLSDDAEFSTKPELEIFADDVQCGHGATVTEIDRSHLFYLMARGIDEKTARGLLVRAFLAEVIEELEDEAIVDALEARLGDWFAAHG
jgi:Fe-S cluster assembly protein SufD